MRAALSKRLDALEPREPSVVVPNVVTVAYDETAADALARFRRNYAGQIPKRHCVIILPARIDSPESKADFEVRFYSHQNQLVAEAKSARGGVAKNEAATGSRQGCTRSR